MKINTEAINIYSAKAEKNICIYYDADWDGKSFYGCKGAFYVDLEINCIECETYAFHICEDTTFMEQFVEFVAKLTEFFNHKECKKIIKHLMGDLYASSLNKIKVG